MRRNDVAKRKVSAVRDKQVPLWLPRLDRVKVEMRGTRFPRTAEEGFASVPRYRRPRFGGLRTPSVTLIRGSEEQLQTERRRFIGDWSMGFEIVSRRPPGADYLVSQRILIRFSTDSNSGSSVNTVASRRRAVAMQKASA